jgi:hypothetical protein
LYKRELIDPRGDWQGVDDVMVATADWVQWYNEVRIHSYSGDMPPKMYEEIYYKALASGKLGTSLDDSGVGQGWLLIVVCRVSGLVSGSRVHSG